MSVGDQLGIEEDSELLDVARNRWPEWVRSDPRLDVVEQFDDLRAWLSTVERAAADQVLLALAMRGAPDGGDEVAAAAALAKCLLPGACQLAGWLLSLPTKGWTPEDSQPVLDCSGSLSTRINELVAAQLWIEIRTFPWRRLTKVASNIMMRTKYGVLKELGDFVQVCRSDRTWAHTTPIEIFSYGDRPTADPGNSYSRADHVPSMLSQRTLRLADTSEEGSDDAEAELFELLDWACSRDVISATDRRLLLVVVDEASRVPTRNLSRGCGGLLATEVSRRTAERVGVAEATVRRHAARSMRALAAAAPGQFGYGR
ncbi:hypothetical protein [Nocardioides sp. Root190]|uniref:hypothetical protein n=1 Tax=Nocardioides sp. Root190 TaxID=1736488 RepID=UPI000AF31E19|nr:hypothetical protein [Nocardioides sp. Root190]